ncbi:flagellin FliC [Methylobacillus arboreus]|uniref:flagellin domain-containing protein n=1 Tax=Methylobacillus arboreus TaxID=755170 RepID=UPI001E40C77D|nr:flagellin domain-containing protein [Methylobacillus arboreus]MCB5189254.1 flagellin FliC [Methylobacillus arboreus]
MAAIINTNLASLNAQRNLTTSQSSLNTSLQRLSSGLRVNSAKDDAAGLSIATRMDAQIRGQTVAIRNANDAISLAQTAEGALGKITDALQRMRELAVQSANATNETGDRDNLQAEFEQLQEEITRLTDGTKFNNKALFDGTAGSLTFQVGAGTTSQDTITVTGINLSTGDVATAAASGISIDGADNTNATAAIDAIDDALDTVNTERATLGAVQNRFESVVSSLQVSVENQSAAKSRILDADFAAETANLTRAQILQQAGTAMLAQANSVPNSVLTLLQG